MIYSAFFFVVCDFFMRRDVNYNFSPIKETHKKFFVGLTLVFSFSYSRCRYGHRHVHTTLSLTHLLTDIFCSFFLMSSKIYLRLVFAVLYLKISDKSSAITVVLILTKFSNKPST